MYVNKLIFGPKSLEILEWFKDQLMEDFSVNDLGDVKISTKLEIIWGENTCKIDQKGYIQDS